MSLFILYVLLILKLTGVWFLSLFYGHILWDSDLLRMLDDDDIHENQYLREL